MINVIYLVIILIGSNGVTSVTIPQTSQQQCQQNVQRFNDKKNLNIVNGYGSGAKTQGAFCVTGGLK